MKKIVILGLALVLTLSTLAACGGGAAATTSPSSTKAETTSGSSAGTDAVGAFTEDREATAEDKAIFDEAMGDKASNYEVLKVATQVVAGTNYRFLVRVVNGDIASNAHVFIFKSLNADEKAKFVKEEPVEVKA